jgi:hypothetical protein
MAEAKEKKVVTLQDIYDGYAAKAKESGKETEVDIAGKHNIEFIEDFGQFKKGHVQDVSKVMYDYYKANGVVKLTKKSE